MDDLSLTSSKPNAWLAVRALVFVAYFALVQWLTSSGALRAHLWKRLLLVVAATLYLVTIVAIRKLWLASHA